jgi:glucose-1-phosphate thymidylyltransferase
VVTDSEGAVKEIQVKQRNASSSWIWGAFRLPASVLAELHGLWREREESDQYIGTLVNAYLSGGGRAEGVFAGEEYVDVGTIQGYRGAVTLLASRTGAPAQTTATGFHGSR